MRTGTPRTGTPGLRLVAEVVTLHTVHEFLIARGGQRAHRRVWVRLMDEAGVEGWGEAAPSAYYGETPDTVLAALDDYAAVLAGTDGWSLEAIERALLRARPGNASARAAVSAALHDLQGKRLGVPLWTLWGLDATATPASSFTIALAPDADTLRTRVREVAHLPILKVKLGSTWDHDIMRIVRAEAPQATLRVDANAAWSAEHAIAMSAFLADLGVDLLEQPVAREDIDGLRAVRAQAPMPVVADESCHVARDIPGLVGAVDGVNIKLAKCGSLREALRMIAVARAHDLRVMCGCMIESSLGIAAAAQLSPLLDDADLDGAALLADDPFVGAGFAAGRVRLTDGAGLGVALAAPAALGSRRTSP